MPVLLRIAVRNLIEHRGKTIIIGTLVALGVVVLIVGNALMDTARAGIERAFIDNYTGDIMISGTAEGPISLFGVQSVGGIEPTPVLPEFQAIASFVANHPSIASWTTQITGFGFLRPEDERVDGLRNSVLTVLFGAEPESYAAMFDNVRVVEGRHLRPGEQGLMISTSRRRELEESALRALEDEPDGSYTVSVGDEIRVVGLTSDGLPSIRVVPLVGVYEMTGIGEGVGFELVSYLDPQTLRAMLRLNLGRDGETLLDASQTALLDRAREPEGFDLDDLFGAETVDAEATVSLLGTDEDDDPFHVDRLFSGSAQIPVDRRDSDDSIGPDADARSASQTWHYVLARVDPPRLIPATIADMNRFFDESGIDARAASWEAAAGPFATTADVVRTVFNVAIIVIGVVAVIIMTNTLVISVMERTSEIGTMRALGAQRGFVRRMFVYEVLAITTIFGAAGVLLSLGIIGVLHAIGIPATNTFLTVLFAGPELKPAASMAGVATAVLVVTLIGLLAHIYPVSIALRIQPVRAIQPD